MDPAFTTPRRPSHITKLPLTRSPYFEHPSSASASVSVSGSASASDRGSPAATNTTEGRAAIWARAPRLETESESPSKDSERGGKRKRRRESRSTSPSPARRIRRTTPSSTLEPSERAARVSEARSHPKVHHGTPLRTSPSRSDREAQAEPSSMTASHSSDDNYGPETSHGDAIEDCAPDAESDSQSDSEDSDPEPPLTDPLYAFYFRLYTHAFTRLYLAKPVLIQERVASDPWKLLVAVMLLNKTAGKLAIPVFDALVARWGTPGAMSDAPQEELERMLRPLGLYRRRAERLKALSRTYVQQPPELSAGAGPQAAGASPPCTRTTRTRTRTNSTPSPGGTSTGTRHRPTRKRRPTSTLPDPDPHPPHGQSRHPEPPRPRPHPHPHPAPCPAPAPALDPRTPISHLPGAGRYARDSYRIFCGAGTAWRDVRPTDKELRRYLLWKWALCEGKRWTPEDGVLGPVDGAYLEALIAHLRRTAL